MRGTDVVYKRVKFESFVELAKLVNYKDDGDNKYFSAITLRYDGTNIAGDLEIATSPGNDGLRKEFLQKAADIVELM